MCDTHHDPPSICLSTPASPVSISTTVDLNQICDGIIRKDARIFDQAAVIDQQAATIRHQTAVIKAQIEEIHKLKASRVQFYVTHPKDTYVINFGNKAWRTLTYRDCISTKAGKKVCDWALTKKSKSTLEFRQYLIDVGYIA